MIQPTVGRLVHYRPAYAHAAPLAALVVGVHDERSVNLTVFHDDGSTFPSLETVLLQDDDAAPVGKPYAEWMAFQKGQVPASSAVEQRLGAVEEMIKTGGPIHQTVEHLHNRVEAVEQRQAQTPSNGEPNPPQTTEAQAEGAAETQSSGVGAEGAGQAPAGS